MKVAIVGAGGRVGKELTRQFAVDHQVWPLTHPDFDITNAQAVGRVLFSERPHLIINCAVLGVAACELDPGLAWSVNVVGAENLANSARALDADFLQLSTNYVFDGKLPSDSFRPNTVNRVLESAQPPSHSDALPVSEDLELALFPVWPTALPEYISEDLH